MINGIKIIDIIVIVIISVIIIIIITNHIIPATQHTQTSEGSVTPPSACIQKRNGCGDGGAFVPVTYVLQVLVCNTECKRNFYSFTRKLHRAPSEVHFQK